MVKLTTELIMNSFQFINPVKDRELDLRGKRQPNVVWFVITENIIYLRLKKTYQYIIFIHSVLNHSLV